jgi:UTP--glucose-1-phosphate uridylyltransferase
MIAAYGDSEAGHLVAAMDVAADEVSSYGVLSPLSENGPLVKARGMVEKPAPEDAPSRTAVVGRYVLDGAIFDHLETQTPGAGGEIQLTDAIAAGVAEIGLAGFRFSGTRFDCGSKQGMLAAKLHLARQDPDFDEVIDDLVTERQSAIAAE